jgi:hypothetical protein
VALLAVTISDSPHREVLQNGVITEKVSAEKSASGGVKSGQAMLR